MKRKPSPPSHSISTFYSFFSIAIVAIIALVAIYAATIRIGWPQSPQSYNSVPSVFNSHTTSAGWSEPYAQYPYEDPQKKTQTGFSLVDPFILGANDKLAVTDLYNKDSMTLSGISLIDVDHIVVTYTPAFGSAQDRDVYRLKSFKPGDTTWKYSIGTNLKNLQPGLNEYVIQAMDAKNKVLEQKKVILYISDPKAIPRTQSSQGAERIEPLPVDWHEPRKTSLLDVLKKNADYDRYLHFATVDFDYDALTDCLMGDGTVTHKQVITQEAVLKRLGEIVVYDVGTVSDGSYAGATLFAELSVGGCMLKTSNVLHFLQLPDGILHGLVDSTSSILRQMPFDGKSWVEAESPASVDIRGHKQPLMRCDGNSCSNSNLTMLDPATAKKAQGFLPGQEVYEGIDGCYEVPRKDGFLEEYTTIPIRGSMTIQWNDGTTTTSDYTAQVGGGCSYGHGCALVSDETAETLKRVGTMDKTGYEVYEEKISKQELVAMETGSTVNVEGIMPISDLYWTIPRYDSADVPTPAEFIAMHPAIYVKDQLGRFLYFRLEKFGPQVECGKPVIYLYPEKEQDVSVRVYPTGGLTITDPDYGDGWNVRATPKSAIYNYADKKTYPYLFWEGHGKDYTRPSRGFVVAKDEVQELLKEKLALLGLNEKESADFREFWEPKLMDSPYVFVTFLDQPTFDTIAPLEVEPAPDTVIRVFMDYEPLQVPVVVEPLEITTPVRRGFTVIEWGGALHPQGNGFACSSPVLLR